MFLIETLQLHMSRLSHAKIQCFNMAENRLGFVVKLKNIIKNYKSFFYLF